MKMDWPMFRTVERQAIRMAKMMEKLGVDPLKLVRLRRGEAYSEARTKCLHCANVQECLPWLDADPPSTKAPSFCANVEVFEQCKKE
jgi:hypothetical protein